MKKNTTILQPITVSVEMPLLPITLSMITCVMSGKPMPINCRKSIDTNTSKSGFL